VAQGVEPNKAYGVRGIASGRMPHFNQTLTENQIRQIVEYERSL
jgi:mono/diheme cytochrome c family protein